MEALAFHLENFEGPLELLLHLISRHKMKVTDIEIGALLTQYLDYVGKMQEANLEISSAFLEMAARLVYIKTVSLLPRHEEAAELKKELEGAADRVPAGQRGGQKPRRPLPAVGGLCPQAGAGPFRSGLPGDCFPQKAAGGLHPRLRQGGEAAAAPAEAFNGIVNRRFVSVTSRIVWLLRRLYRDGPGRVPGPLPVGGAERAGRDLPGGFGAGEIGAGVYQRRQPDGIPQ